MRSAVLAMIAATAQAAAAPPAGPLAAPGDQRLRHDLLLLVDAGVLDLPISAWPIPWRDIESQLEAASDTGQSAPVALARQRVRAQANAALAAGENRFGLRAAVAERPRAIRTFEDTPRDEGELALQYARFGARFSVNLAATVVADPLDGDEVRPDDTWLGIALGNWIVSAGWQQRWWGPGNDASLILSTNARPAPGIALQRHSSTAFESKWLRWIGPWSLVTFMERLDDERAVEDALLWGFRAAFRPLDSLEIGLSRTAQWCGDDRPCDLGTFTDVLLGNDNKGVNVDPDEEPGNQLAGFDLRWSLPAGIPAALYLQWIGEDSRDGGPLIGSWLRQAGGEVWGRIGGFSHRTHVEWADTVCREGGFGSSDQKPDCAYNHPIYASGYRYNSRAIGHAMDGDGRYYGIGSTLVQPDGSALSIGLRYMDINTLGEPDLNHTVSPTEQEIFDAHVTYARGTAYGRFHIGVGYTRTNDLASGLEDGEASAFLEWRSR